jgi:hypothetical protein
MRLRHHVMRQETSYGSRSPTVGKTLMQGPRTSDLVPSLQGVPELMKQASPITGTRWYRSLEGMNGRYRRNEKFVACGCFGTRRGPRWIGGQRTATLILYDGFATKEVLPCFGTGGFQW